MDKETDPIIGCLTIIVASILNGLLFQYNVYTLIEKDVYLWLDILAGLLIMWPRIGKIRILAVTQVWLFVGCFIGRFILGFNAPWIGQ